MVLENRRRAVPTMLDRFVQAAVFLAVALVLPASAWAGEADLKLPDLGSVQFMGAISGHNLLLFGLIICVAGLGFGYFIYRQLNGLPVHRSMRDISELIYETCKTYLLTQGKFILYLELFIGAVILAYFGWLQQLGAGKVLLILFFSLVGIAGSYGVAWFGIRVNTLANSRTAFAALAGKPFPAYSIPLRAGMSIGTMLISVELIIMLAILLFIPGELAGPCFIGFAIGESLGAAALRIAGGIFTKIADIGSDLMKIVFNIKEDDARNPGVIADCTGDNAGDSVGPTADGFETYGVTGVALITFIILAVFDPTVQIQLLVWIFAMRVMMVISSVGSYAINEWLARRRYLNVSAMNFEQPLTNLVWLTSIVSIVMTFAISYLLIPELGEGKLWLLLSLIISCGTLAGALIPEVVKVFTSTESKHVKEVVTASREGGASLNVLSGLVAGNFSGYWLGLVIIALMAFGYFISTMGLESLMFAPAVFAFGLVAFGFLGMGPVTIAVDSYGPVTDNAQSVFELSVIETLPNIQKDIKRDFGFEPDFELAKHHLESNDGAGNTFKATAKPVLIGTAVVGATTLIFSIIVMLTHGLTTDLEKLSIVHPPFLLGLIAGGAVIYWFTGASIQAVVTGSYRAVEFIKKNIKLDSSAVKASTEDSKKVVAICTQYAQKGMFNIFFAIFFSTLAFAFIEPFFFIGYLISIALFGLYQALFMANAGGAWDNAKKVVEVDLKEKGSDLHAACVVGDTVGDPFKDTSSVALNPVIKFTTLFGLLAVELAVEVTNPDITNVFSVIFFALSVFFVFRSFYGMRITGVGAPASKADEASAAKNSGEQAKRPIDKKLGEQAKRPMDKESEVKASEKPAPKPVVEDDEDELDDDDEDELGDDDEDELEDDDEDELEDDDDEDEEEAPQASSKAKGDAYKPLDAIEKLEPISSDIEGKREEPKKPEKKAEEKKPEKKAEEKKPEKKAEEKKPEKKAEEKKPEKKAEEKKPEKKTAGTKGSKAPARKSTQSKSKKK